MTALTGFPTATNSTTLATARTLATAASGTPINIATRVALRTGLHELLSQGVYPVSTPTVFASNANATTVTNNVPSGVQNGDLLLWIIDGNVAAQPATPTGWAVFNAMVTTTAQGLTIFSRTASSEPASYSATVSAGKWNGIMVAYRNVDATTPKDATPTSVAANAPPSLAAITTVTAGALVCGTAGYNTLSGVTNSTWSSSTGTVEAQTTGTLAAVNVTSALMDQATSAAGAVSPNLAVSPTTGSRSASVTFALRPADTGAALAATGTAIGSIPAQPHGWLWDVTTLEAQQLVSGSVQPTLRVFASATTISGLCYVRYWKRSSGGVYTLIATFAEASTSAFTTAAATRTLPAATITQTDFATGDKFYAEVIVDVTANTAASATSTISIAELGTTAGQLTTFPTAGYVATANLTGTSAGAATATGSVSVRRAIAGTAAGVATGTGAVRVARALAGTAQGVATGTDSFPVARKLTGTAHGVAVTSGTVRAAWTLTGSSHGVGAATGSITAARPLTGAAAGLAGAHGALTVARKLTGSPAGVATATGSLHVARPATGTATGVSSAAGSLRVGWRVAGVSAGAATSSGSLRVARTMSGTSAGVAGASGAVKVARLVAGTAHGVAVTSGTLTVTAGGTMAGAAAGVGVASGSLRDARALSGTAVGVGTARDPFSLTVHWILTGTAAGRATATGAVARAVPLTGTAAGVAGAAGAVTTGATVVLELWESGAFVATLGTYPVTSIGGQVLSARWDASLLADPSGAGVELRIASTSNAGVDVGAVEWNALVYSSTGELLILSGKADGVGRASGSVLVRHPLGGTATGVGTASGTLPTSRVLSGEADGVGRAAGSVARAVPLTGQAHGVGGATGTVKVRGVRGVIVATIGRGPEIVPVATAAQIAAGAGVATQIVPAARLRGVAVAASTAAQIVGEGRVGGELVAASVTPAGVTVTGGRRGIVVSQPRRRQIAAAASSNQEVKATANVSGEVSGGDAP